MNFFEQQAVARRTSARLVFLMAVAIAGIVLAVDAVVWVATQSPELVLFATLSSVAVIALGSLYRIASLGGGGEPVAQQLGGTLVPESTTEPGLRRLRNVVEEIAIASGVPVPKVYVLEHEAGINAFAAGYSTSDAVIAVTRGALDRLNRDELQGVVAHEMGHVANNDVLYMTAVGVLVGLIVVVSDLALRSTRVMGRSSQSDRKGGGGVAILAIVVLIAVGLLSPIAATLVQMAVSRQREYLADATAVKLTRNPLGLIGALRKLDQAPVRWDDASKAVQHLFIVNPFKKFGENASALMSTHPSVEQRVQRLQDLG